ncbi:MAG: hypothetical protein Q7S28_00295, partial [bacterium]|nr:hypothetical protein [bacterium]
MKNEVVEIVLTSGPCGGKTTALERIPPLLENLGVNILVGLEIATQFMEEKGIDLGAIAGKDFSLFMQYEREMFARQMR